jgi:hypothetical protein
VSTIYRGEVDWYNGHVHAGARGRRIAESDKKERQVNAIKAMTGFNNPWNCLSVRRRHSLEFA